MRLFTIAALLGAALAASTASAQPAPWYKWRSNLNGREFCFQTSPGPGWTRVSGPYKDARCERPGRPVWLSRAFRIVRPPSTID